MFFIAPTAHISHIIGLLSQAPEGRKVYRKNVNTIKQAPEGRKVYRRDGSPRPKDCACIRSTFILIVHHHQTHNPQNPGSDKHNTK